MTSWHCALFPTHLFTPLIPKRVRICLTSSHEATVATSCPKIDPESTLHILAPSHLHRELNPHVSAAWPIVIADARLGSNSPRSKLHCIWAKSLPLSRVTILFPAPRFVVRWWVCDRPLCVVSWNFRCDSTLKGLMGRRFGLVGLKAWVTWELLYTCLIATSITFGEFCYNFFIRITLYVILLQLAQSKSCLRV